MTTLLFPIEQTTAERKPDLLDLLRADFRQFDQFGVAAMHQAFKKLGNIAKCREIEQYVEDTPHLKSKIRRLEFYKPIENNS
jgi:hypothetical protein